MEGMRVCVAGSKESAFAGYIGSFGISAMILTFGDIDEAIDSLLAGECSALSALVFDLARVLDSLPSNYSLLLGEYDANAYALATPVDDSRWLDVVNIAVGSIIWSDAWGLGSEMPAVATGDEEVDRVLGFAGSWGQEDLGVDQRVVWQVVTQVGSYGEIYDEAMGPLSVSREGGANAYWVGSRCSDCPKGGLLRAPSFQ